MVINSIKKLAASKGLKANLQAGTGKSVKAGPDILSALGHVFDPEHVYKGSKTNEGAGMPGVGTVVPFQGKSINKTVGNALKDAVDLPAQVITSGAQIASDTANKGPLAGLNDIITPYKQLIANPGKVSSEHPLDTYLMLAGPLHGATRVLDAGARAAKEGDALARPSVQLKGNLTHERPRYSPYPIIRGGQKALEKKKFTRNASGQLVPKDPHVAAKLAKIEASRLVGVNERIRRVNRHEVIQARADAVRPSRVTKVAHAAKTALKYDPARSAIPGGQVLARIADKTIRSKKTFVEDLEKHIQQVAANRPNLLDTPLLKEHDAYVKELKAVRDRKLTPEQLDHLFTASEKYAKDYGQVEAAAHRFGQFGNRSKDALLKRSLYHYASTHMGAKFDPEKGLVDSRGHELSTRQILNHVRANGVEGEIAFTSDKPRRGSKFYVSQERRPRPEMTRNTLFAFEHGLTDPGHEALLQQHVHMQGIVDAHNAQNRLISNNVVMREDGKPFSSYKQAQAKAPGDGHYVPIALSEPFHPQSSLDKALEPTNPATLDHEAIAHSLDLSSRLEDHGQGRWGLIDRNVRDRIEEHKNAISPDTTSRLFKSLNNQFRQVALGTSAKHVPGVLAEQVIRDITSGVGLSSWITGRRLLAKGKELDPELGRRAEIEMRGGQMVGATKMAITHQTSEHFYGTNLYKPLRLFENAMKRPGPRQLGVAWHAWLHFALNGTKHFIEEQHNVADVGKTALKAFGSEHGPFFKMMRLQGDMLDDAAKGLFDEKKLKQFHAEARQIRGIWTDLTPAAQKVMMFSPFGLWWVNSVKWLARSPIDRPIGTGLAAAANVGTQKQRFAKGMDLFAPNALPLYMQGGIPAGGKVIAQNYYSPFGVANDPLQTAQSLAIPTAEPILAGLAGDNWLGHTIRSPGNPRGYKEASPGDRLTVVVNSILSSFVPFYTKAQTIMQGGASPFDTSTFLSPQTKKPGSFGAGVAKAVQPFRSYRLTSGSDSGSGEGSLKDSLGGSGLGGSLHESLGSGSGSGSLSESLK